MFNYNHNIINKNIIIGGDFNFFSDTSLEFQCGNPILKVHSCKLYNNKYMIAPTQVTNTEIFAFIAIVVLKLLSRKVLFINRKTIETVKK